MDCTARRWPREGLLALALVVMAVTAGCTEKPTTALDDGGIPASGPYSATVQRIFDRSCATSGCHGAVSPEAGLELTSWETLIAGSRFGEVVIPFRPADSHMIDHLTGAATPRMPLSPLDPLPEREIDIIRRWVADGARNDAEEVPYAGSRRKLYVTNQASDKISVIDAGAQVVMRLIDVGVLPNVDSPHNVHVDRQGRYWYVTLINSARLLQFEAETDSLRAMAVVGQSPANPVTSPDGRTVYVTNWNPNNATLHALDTETLTEKYVLHFPPGLGDLPHGLCVTRDGRTLYTTHEGSGSVFKIEVGETAEDAVLTYVSLGEPAASLRPLQVLLDRDERHLFVTCNGSGEVRVVDTQSLEVVRVLPIGGRPWLEALTPDGRLIYVGNWGKDGVDVIDTASMEVVSSLTNGGLEEPVFARPHGVAITPDGRYAFVTSENTNGTIPQHHPTEGGGHDGSVTVIEVGTNRIEKTLTVEVDPTGIAFVELPGR